MHDSKHVNKPTTNKKTCKLQKTQHDAQHDANQPQHACQQLFAHGLADVGSYSKMLSDGNWHLIFSPLLDRAHREAILACKNRAGIEKAFTASSLCDSTTRPSCHLACHDHCGDHWILLSPTCRCCRHTDLIARRCVAPFAGVPPAAPQNDAFELQL